MTAVDQSLVTRLRRALQAAADVHAAERTDDDITMAQFIVLDAAANLGRASQTALVEATGIDRSTLADIVHRLQTKHLIERRRSRKDARAKIVSITPEAATALTRSAELTGKVERQLVSGLSRDEAELLGRLLDKVAAAFPAKA